MGDVEQGDAVTMHDAVSEQPRVRVVACRMLFLVHDLDDAGRVTSTKEIMGTVHESAFDTTVQLVADRIAAGDFTDERSST